MKPPDTEIPVMGGLKWVKIIFLLLLLPHLSWSQTTWRIDQSSEITVNGTSSLHDWISTVNKIVGGADIDLSANKIRNISDLKVIIPVTAIKSGKKGMDKNTYKALKSQEYPEIKYTLTEYTAQPGNKLITNGKLTIAGISKPAPIKVSYVIHTPEKVEFLGEIKFNMTEFNVVPPTALLGSIKTGDEVAIKFKVFFVQL